jgi:Uma2 family endonuclease
MATLVQAEPIVEATLAPTLESVGDHLILSGVPWRTYLQLLRLFDDRHLRITYDQGALEIMTLSAEHEYFKRLLDRLLTALVETLGWELTGLGSLTLKRSKLQRGLEPDECYWIQHEAELRQPKRYNIHRDPPPDLVIEIDITHPSLDRLPIYAAFGVPEVWRYDGAALHFHILTNGTYTDNPNSQVFPFLAVADVARFIDLRSQVSEVETVRQFRTWISERMATNWQ